MATIGITMAAISPVDSFLLELPFEEPVEEPVEVESVVRAPAVEVGLLAFPPPAVVEISASIVPAEFPHPRERAV